MVCVLRRPVCLLRRPVCVASLDDSDVQAKELQQEQWRVFPYGPYGSCEVKFC